jgi:DNA-binding response OmpR family regulator/HPt (histidine-containing phosphotransfer) domain-containing protein
MKILFIEDDQSTSELLSTTLSRHHYAVDAVADGSVGLELATQWNYDLILLDILIPTLNGIEVCQRLRAQGCQTPILILTTKDSDEDVIAGLDAGADDYVAKSCAPSQLLARMRALLRRGLNASSTPVLTWGLLCLDPVGARVTYNQTEIALRPKEYSLLELFLRHPQRVFNRSAIIDHLWSMEETPVEASVTNLIKDLRQRLKSTGMTDDLIETVYGLGYRLKAAPIESNRAFSSSAAVASNDWTIQERRGIIAVQRIVERFRVSLEQRIEILEAVSQSLQTGDLGLKQLEAARKEAHKLAGGLGTFGYVRASEVVQAIECLLTTWDVQETRCAQQLVQLLEELRQEMGSTV